MRGLFLHHTGYPGFGSNPMLLGIAVALAEMYEPLIRETLPDRWTNLVAAFDASPFKR